MSLESNYRESVTEKHRKDLGQFFTPPEIARFMCKWACEHADSMLDPAVGNSIFLNMTRSQYPACRLYGYEIDEKILRFFGNPASADIRNEDYLLQDWDVTYDAIVCNPPYNRFQSVANRDVIQDTIQRYTGIRYSTYTNLYILFLLKSLHQLSEDGRMAYLIPSEFLNSGYGTVIKEKLIKEHLLFAILNFNHNEAVFEDATTTCCILLLDRTVKEHILFYNLDSAEELGQITLTEEEKGAVAVSYDALSSEEKWRALLYQEEALELSELVELSTFCKVTRGIATGANDFFCMTPSQAAKEQIDSRYLTRCICRSRDVKGPIFTETDYEELYQKDKTVCVLDIPRDAVIDEALTAYIAKGKEAKVDQKYLPARRHPWYRMEQQKPAPILATTACRDGIRFIRNLAGVHSLTTFHAVYVREEYSEYTDILFCYFLTPSAQRIIRRNRKELGNGLDKFQPSDFQKAKMLDITRLSDKDCQRVRSIYHKMQEHFEKEQIDRLDAIFCAYI